MSWIDKEFFSKNTVEEEKQKQNKNLSEKV